MKVKDISFRDALKDPDTRPIYIRRKSTTLLIVTKAHLEQIYRFYNGGPKPSSMPSNNRRRRCPIV